MPETSKLKGVWPHGGKGMPAGAAHRHGGSSVRLLAHIWVGQEAESKAGLSYVPPAPPPSNPFSSPRMHPLKAP